MPYRPTLCRFSCWLGRWAHSKWAFSLNLNLSKVCKSASEYTPLYCLHHPQYTPLYLPAVLFASPSVPMCRPGLRLLSAHDLPTLKASLNQVAIKVDNDPDIFQSFYQFAFKFCLTVRALTSLKGCFARCTQLGLCCCALSWLGCHTWIPRVI